MKRYLLAGLLTAIILFPLFWYVYSKGAEDGVVRYKHSRNLQMALDSAYFYGRGDAVADCCNGDITCGGKKWN